ncbi:ATP-grasp domain-containing protein [Paludisphaera rhizosphaerae]|uniref:ATP-grasp domain-containing protein n=1 Tax=Paludisphaera rhizosphaerae TaxID=2711216 RepID=UPI0013EAE7B1|nr:ATP-grasp domain-containing protein [Paludisphaera rhizosphaerae]
MNPTWLIEAGVYRDEADLLLSEIRRQGMIGSIVPHGSLKAGASLAIDGQPVPPDRCVIGYGTFPFARQIQLHHEWAPGAWCDAEKLDCSTYFAYYGKYLLNQHYAIMPGVEAIRQSDWVFTVFGVDDEVFARPAGCQKHFVGRCVHSESFAAALSPTRYDPATQVVIAAPKEIGREWRLIVAEDKVIAASQYSEDGTKSIAAGCPVEVLDFAAAILADVSWRPDPIFMMDICESKGRLWLVELNGFSCSWLYQCDLSDVVRKASELAIRQWQTLSPRAT